MNWPQGCCQHLRELFQWKPNCESWPRTVSAGCSGKVTQTHLPTTSARPYTSGNHLRSNSSTRSVERARFSSRCWKFTYGSMRVGLACSAGATWGCSVVVVVSLRCSSGRLRSPELDFLFDLVFMIFFL